MISSKQNASNCWKKLTQNKNIQNSHTWCSEKSETSQIEASDYHFNWYNIYVMIKALDCNMFS